MLRRKKISPLYVKIYRNQNGEISQIGQITGEIEPLEGDDFASGWTSDELGWSLALSGDGSTLVAAAPGNKKVKIYNNVDDSWNQLGEDINLESELNSTNYLSVDISKDGNFIVVGNPSYNSKDGQLKVFQFFKMDTFLSVH